MTKKFSHFPLQITMTYGPGSEEVKLILSNLAWILSETDLKQKCALGSNMLTKKKLVTYRHIQGLAFVDLMDDRLVDRLVW